jgi:hypothetical protein
LHGQGASNAGCEPPQPMRDLQKGPASSRPFCLLTAAKG